MGRLGLSRKDYSCITYLDYILTCIGAKDVDLSEARRHRDLMWVAYCGYKDPKKEPKTIQRFMPLEGDEIIKVEPPSQERLLELDQSFRLNFGRKKKDVSSTTIS